MSETPSPNAPVEGRKFKVFIDDVEVKAAQVGIVWEDVFVPGEDSPGLLEIKATPEGVIRDVYVTRKEHLDHNLATDCSEADDVVAAMVAAEDGR